MKLPCRRTNTSGWAALTLALCAGWGLAQAKVVVTHWDLPGGSGTFLYDVNSAGAMVGYAIENDLAVGLLLKDGVVNRLTGPAGALGSFAGGISDGGTVVGTWNDSSAMRQKIVYSANINPATGLQDEIIVNVPTQRGLFWQNGGYSSYTVTLPGSVDTQLLSISSDGRKVLGYSPDTGQYFVLDRPSGAISLVSNIANVRQPRSINNAQQTVGDRFIPGVGTQGYVRNLGGGPVSPYNLPGLSRTAPRAINELGEVAGWTPNAAGQPQAFLNRAAGLQTFDVAGSTSTIAYGLNETGQAVGFWVDRDNAAHGFMATDVLLPEPGGTPGTFQFSVPVLADTPIFIDPTVAVGYVYTLGAGDPKFKTVSLPWGIGDNRYTLTADGISFNVMAQQVFDFTLHGFAEGVSQFTVTGIEPEAVVDPANPQAFVTRLTFAGNGRFTGSQVALTMDFTPGVPESGTGPLLATGLLAIGLAWRRRSVGTCRVAVSQR